MTDERNETWADIAADIRERAENVKRHGDERPTSGEAIGNLLLSIADRIVEAVTREGIRRDKTSFHCGDCAKFGFDCDAGDVDGNEDCLACENFVRGDHLRDAAKMVGNSAKMREVLDRVHQLLGRLIRDDLVEDAPEASDMADDVWDALNEPPRNCDVGTAWEQAERFKEYCHSNSVFYRDMFGHDDEGRLDGWDCKKECPVGLIVDGHECLHDHCELVWAQMPYTETAKEGGET